MAVLRTTARIALDPDEMRAERSGGSSRTSGLDMSTSPAKTAAVAVAWSPDQARITQILQPLRASAIVDLIAAHAGEHWAVDVPFGWPDRFVALMADRQEMPLPPKVIPDDTEWELWRTKWVAQRRTDAFLTTDPRIRTRPLPASFQMLGATAAMWALIEARLAQRGVAIDRSGVTGLVCETYPRAALAAWLHIETTKANAAQLGKLFPYLIVPEEHLARLANDDVCDAIVCAMVARARSLGLTIAPSDADQSAAAREGWIHVTTENPAALLQTP
jgi:hypothetical protein